MNDNVENDDDCHADKDDDDYDDGDGKYVMRIAVMNV